MIHIVGPLHEARANYNILAPNNPQGEREAGLFTWKVTALARLGTQIDFLSSNSRHELIRQLHTGKVGGIAARAMLKIVKAEPTLISAMNDVITLTARDARSDQQARLALSSNIQSDVYLWTAQGLDAKIDKARRGLTLSPRIIDVRPDRDPPPIVEAARQARAPFMAIQVELKHTQDGTVEMPAGVEDYALLKYQSTIGPQEIVSQTAKDLQRPWYPGQQVVHALNTGEAYLTGSFPALFAAAGHFVEPRR
jgi:hypothetical protein